jgi:voltage-gated potassium channel
VCGYGRLGQFLCADLAKFNLPIVVLDTDENRYELAIVRGFSALLADATTDDTLFSAGIERARVLVSALPSDALNVFITLTARGLCPNLAIMARGEDIGAEPKLKRAGANQVVQPFGIAAERMAHLITRPNVLEFFQEADLGALGQELGTIGIEIDQFEVTGDSKMIRRTVGELESSGQGGFMVVAVRRAGGKLVQNPKKDFEFAEEDRVLLMGHKDDLPDLTKRFSLKTRQRIYRGLQVR